MAKHKKPNTKNHGNKSNRSSSNSFSAYNEACDYLKEMWKTGHSLRSLVYDSTSSSKKKKEEAEESNNNNGDTATASVLICSIRTFAILSNVIRVQKPLQDLLNESIITSTGTEVVGNTALLLIMAYELLLSKQKKIAGGGAIKRLLITHEPTLRAKIQQNDTLRHEYERQQKQQQQTEEAVVTTPLDQFRDDNQQMNDSTISSRHDAHVKPYHFRLLVKQVDEDQQDVDDDDEDAEIDDTEPPPPPQQSTTVQQLLLLREILSHATPDPLLPQVYVTSTIPKARLVAHPNLFLIQSQASCLPAYCLYQALQKQEQHLQPNRHVILDACAAPGNKTLQLASYFFDRNSDKSSSPTANVIIALDKDVHRHEILRCRCAKLYPDHHQQIQTMQQDFLQYGNPAVTALLLDPSCSGGHSVTGMSGDGTATTTTTSRKTRLDQLAAFQTKALLHALSGFPQCQTVVYSTCSPTLEENEAVVQYCLEQQQSTSSSSSASSPTSSSSPHDWKLLTALPEWTMRGRDDCNDKTIRAATLRHAEGFFVAVFHRTFIDADATNDTAKINAKKRRKKQQWKERQQTEAKRRRVLQKKSNKKKKEGLSQPPPPQQKLDRTTV
jgi:16S rRNA C967 or C1407 C5-methylase (RsmB/RsmF family)